MSRVALITGITGQTGSYLAEFLLSIDYTVHGIIRRCSTFNTDRIDHLYTDPHDQDARLFLHYGDMSDSDSINNIIGRVRPDEVYNLAAQSHVRVSFDIPEYTVDVVANGVFRMLEAIRRLDKDVKYYQASSSEMFGASPPPQNERTAFCPRSPYAISKVAGYHATVLYRDAYDLFTCNGILFNHESNPYHSPILVKHNNAINIIEMGELIKLDSDDLRKTVDYQSRDVMIWDNGVWSKITAVTGYRALKKLVRLNSRQGCVELTAGHKLHTDSGPMDIDQIDIGSRLCGRTLPTIREGTTHEDDDWAWLLGFFAGDGCQHGSSLEFFNKDTKLLQRVEDIIKSRYEKAVVDWQPHASGFSVGKNNHKIKIAGCPGLVPWLRDNCYSTSRLKRVPSHILNANALTIGNYLRGYCAADGTKSLPKVIYDFQYFTTKSPILAAGLLFLLERMGNTVSFNMQRKEWDSGRISHYIKGQIWSKRDDDRPGQKGASGHNLRKDRYEVTKKFSDELEGPFYDIETESGTFCAGAGLLPMNNSPRRGETFVTRKITKAVAKIALGRQDKLFLGNLDAKRDWGFAGDYVEAMWMMLQGDKPDDYVVATGETHSVREFVEAAFAVLDLNSSQYVHFDERYLRPAEVDALRGDATKIKDTFGWFPKHNFADLVKMMVMSDYEIESRKPTGD